MQVRSTPHVGEAVMYIFSLPFRPIWPIARFLLGWGFFLWLLQASFPTPRVLFVPSMFFLTWVAAWLVDAAVKLTRRSDSEIIPMVPLLNSLIVLSVAGANTRWAQLGVQELALWLMTSGYMLAQGEVWRQIGAQGKKALQRRWRDA
jgi:hypothetical protein